MAGEFDAGAIKGRMVLDRSGFQAGLVGAKQDFQKFDAAVGAMFRGGLIAGGIAFATKQLFGFAKAGANIAETAGIFDRIAGGARRANEILSQTRQVTGQLADSEIRQLGNRLQLIGIGVENLPRLARIAEAISDSTGDSVRSVMDALISGTARTSDRMLAMLGVNVKFEKGLSEDAKQAEFLRQVLQRGSAIVDQFGNSVDTSADKLDRFSTRIKNIRESLDVRAGSNFAKMLDIWSKIFGGLATPIGANVFSGGLTPQFGSTTPGAAGSLFGGALSSDRIAQAALAAQQAAKAYFDTLLMNAGRGDMGTFGAKGGRTGAAALAGFGNKPMGSGWEQIIPFEGGDKGLAGDFQDKFTKSFTVVDDALSALGDSFAGFFEMLVTNSTDAGRAFFSGLMSGFSQMASNMGRLLIWTGTGIEALKKLKGFEAIAAGIALIGLSGILRGIAFNNAPGGTSPTGERHLRQPLRDTANEMGGMTIVVQGDFVGDPVWVDRLASILLGAQRNRGVKVVRQPA